MAALNFPNSPSLNDTHTENGVTFKWNGAAWDRLGDIGAQGSAGAAGAQGAAGPVAGSSSQVVYKDGSNNPAGSANLTFDGTNLTVGGNVSIGGTLTYEDVTNIDSVGIITARSGVKIPDSQKIFLGTADDLQIYHDGSESYVAEEGEGGLTISSGLISFKNQSRSETHATMTVNSGVSLFHNNLEKFKTTSGGIRVLGDTTLEGHLDMRDGDRIRLGGSDELQIYHDGTINRIRFDVNTVFEKNDSEDIATFLPDGAVTLFHNGTARLETTTTGATITNDLVLNHASGDKAIRWATGGTNKWSLYHNNSAGALVAYDNANNAERLRILSTGTVNIGDQGLSDEYLGSTVKIRKDQNSVTRLSLRNENSGSGSASAIQLGAHGNSWMLQCGSTANDSNAFTIRVDGSANSNTGTEKLRITTDGKVGINDTSPASLFTVNNGTNDDHCFLIKNDNVAAYFGTYGTGHGSYPREVTINGTRVDGGSSPFLRVAGQGGIKFCADLNSERMRITPSGEVNIGGSDMTSAAYAFQVSRDLGTPSASGTSLARFRNANGTYSQDLYLKFNNSKDIMWAGGSGNGGMTWQMGTRGYNWEIGGTNKFSVGPSDIAMNGTTDGVLNINTTDGRGPFIRFKENGATKVWFGSAEGMGVGDQDDACLMSVDNIYFRNSTDSRTTLTVSKEGRLTGEKAYPDAGGTLRSNPYYPPTNQYQTYSAPSGGNKWLRFGYFSSRGRYRITFNSTGGYYSPGSVTFDFNLYWASPHVYVGNVNKLSSQYVTQFRVTSDSNGGNYYGEVYVSVNGNQTGSHIHCTAQVLGMADREFNLHNYGYDLSNLSYTSGNFSL